MNLSKLFYSFFSTLIAVFFLLSGIMCLMIPWNPVVQTQIVRLFLENTLALSLFGLAFLIIGTAIIANILINARHRHYHIRCGQSAVAVDEAVIQHYLDNYWAELFPDCEVPNKIKLKKNQIYVFANFPFFPQSEQKSLLNRIEMDLSETFEKVLGYRKEFYLSATFREEQPKDTSSTADSVAQTFT